MHARHLYLGVVFGVRGGSRRCQESVDACLAPILGGTSGSGRVRLLMPTIDQLSALGTPKMRRYLIKRLMNKRTRAGAPWQSLLPTTTDKDDSMKKLISVSLVALIVAVPAAAAPNPKKLATVAGLGVAAGLWIASVRSNQRAEMITRRREISIPEFGEVSKVRPGEAMYANYNYDAVTIARPTKEIIWDPMSDSRLHPGTALYKMINGKFCRESGKGPCWEDADGDGDLDRVGKDPESDKNMKVDLPYELIEVQLDASSEGFRSELVFQGIADGVLHLAYREFVDDMARPAFTQILSYDFEGPTTIAFQTLEFEILEAGNMGIRYKVQEENGSSGP